MTRKKVKLSFITNDSARKATYKKRKKGLIKKVNELSTLCGVSACAIIYSPYDSNPEGWPSNSGVERVISEFKALPEMDQHKRMVDQETFIRQRITKATDHWRRQRKDNREMEMTEIMFQCLAGKMGMFNLNIIDLNDLGYMIDQYLKDLKRRAEILMSSGMEIGESSHAAAPPEGIGSLAVVAATTNSPVASSYVPHAAAPPHAGLYEQSQNQNQNPNPWFREMMNHPEQSGFQFMDDNHHNRNHHQQPQIPEGSSAASTVASSSSVTPATSPNPTNNIWFR